MAPDKAPRRGAGRDIPQIRTGPSPDDAHDVVYFKRHASEDPKETKPAQEFLKDRCPGPVRAKIYARLIAVAKAPPNRFAGGGYWEAMKGDMTGWFELRADGPNRHHYRLFCRLDYEAKNRAKPLLVVITGLDKPFRTELTDADLRASESWVTSTSPATRDRSVSCSA